MDIYNIHMYICTCTLETYVYIYRYLKVYAHTYIYMHMKALSNCQCLFRLWGLFEVYDAADTVAILEIWDHNTGNC